MINKVILMGRLTRDAELRYTGKGTPVASFTIAIDNYRGGKKETLSPQSASLTAPLDSQGEPVNRQTDFINCVAWNKTAEFVSNYFSKGKMIIVIGRISTRSWEGQDGKKCYATEVVASEVSFGESKNGEGAIPSTASGPPPLDTQGEAVRKKGEAGADDFVPLDANDEDLPF